MKIFTKKYWLIKRANLRIIKYKYFYSWQNTLRFLFGIIWGITFLITISFPAMIFEWLNDKLTDNIPQWLKVDENPAWWKMTNSQKREFLQSFKDWDQTVSRETRDCCIYTTVGAKIITYNFGACQAFFD